MYSCLTPKDPSNPSVVTSDLYPELWGSLLLQGFSPALGLFLSPKVELAHSLPYPAFPVFLHQAIGLPAAAVLSHGGISVVLLHTRSMLSAPPSPHELNSSCHPDWLPSEAGCGLGPNLHTPQKDVAMPLRSNMSIRGMALLLSSSFLSFTELSQSPHGEKNKIMWGTAILKPNHSSYTKKKNLTEKSNNHPNEHPTLSWIRFWAKGRKG